MSVKPYSKWDLIGLAAVPLREQRAYSRRFWRTWRRYARGRWRRAPLAVLFGRDRWSPIGFGILLASSVWFYTVSLLPSSEAAKATDGLPTTHRVFYLLFAVGFGVMLIGRFFDSPRVLMIHSRERCRPARAAAAGILHGDAEKLDAARREIGCRIHAWRSAGKKLTFLGQIAYSMIDPRAQAMAIVPLLAYFAYHAVMVEDMVFGLVCVLFPIGYAGMALALCWHAPTIHRLRGALTVGRCCDCRYELTPDADDVPPSALGGVRIGPGVCPECGAPWPLVPPPAPNKAEPGA